MRTLWKNEIMAGVFDIDLDQPDENVSDDELEDGVSWPAELAKLIQAELTLAKAS